MMGCILPLNPCLEIIRQTGLDMDGFYKETGQASFAVNAVAY